MAPTRRPRAHSSGRHRGTGRWTFLTAGIATLSLGIGANVAVFSLTAGLWLRPTGMRDVARVGTVHFRPAMGSDGALMASAPRSESEVLRRLSGASTALEVLVQMDIAKWMRPSVRLQSGRPLVSRAVTHNYFDVAGVAVAGAPFLPEDDAADRRVAIVSDEFATQQFGAAEAAIGKAISTDRVALTVVGVAGRGFHGLRLDDDVDIWLPLGALMTFTIVPADALMTVPVSPILRLDPGQTWQSIQRQMDDLTGGRALVFSIADLRFVPSGLGAMKRQGDLLAALRLISALVFSAACLNVSSLLIARIDSTRRDIAIRLALGATRPRAFVHVLSDVGIVLVGGTLGSLVSADLVLNSVRRLSLPAGVAIKTLSPSLDWISVAAAIAAAGAAMSLAIAMLAIETRTNPAELLGRSEASGNKRSVRRRRYTIFAHTAASFVILCAATSLVTSMATVAAAGRALQGKALVISNIMPSTEAYVPVSTEGARRVVSDFSAAIASLQSTPGVRAATYGDPPVAQTGTVLPVQVVASGTTRSIRLVVARGGEGYVGAIGGRLVAGRDLDQGDLGPRDFVIGPNGRRSDQNAVAGAIVAESLARLLWTERTPLGQRLGIAGRQYVVVGIVEDMLAGLPERIRAPTVVIGAQPSGWLGANLPAVLAALEPLSGVGTDAINKIVRSRFLADTDVVSESLQERLESVTANEQLGARLFGWFGLASAAVGALGMYGLAAVFVGSRRRDLTIRAALGISAARLQWTCTAQLSRAIAGGTVAGAAATKLLSISSAATSVGLDAISVWTYLGVALTLALAGNIAAWLGTKQIRALKLANLVNDTDR